MHSSTSFDSHSSFPSAQMREEDGSWTSDIYLKSNTVNCILAPTTNQTVSREMGHFKFI